MKATAALHKLGQSIWLDNITREMLDSGQLKRYIDDYSVTGLTSNPSIFGKAIAAGGYNEAIREKAQAGVGHEELFFDLAIEDLRRAADLFRSVHATRQLQRPGHAASDRRDGLQVGRPALGSSVKVHQVDGRRTLPGQGFGDRCRSVGGRSLAVGGTRPPHQP